MRQARSILVLLVVGCTTVRTAVVPPATPPSPEPTNQPADRGPWAFVYHSDTLHYQVTRSAAVESQSDSAPHREISTNNTHEILNITVEADTIRYVASVDTFSTTTQGLIGPVQQVSLPVHIAGTVDSIMAVDDSTGTTQMCDPVRSSLQTDVFNLLINVPAQLSPGISWHDSTTRTACWAMIPVKGIVTRNFLVVGAALYNGQRTVVIQRTDSINAHGEGRQQQHQLTVEVSGIGSGVYYLSPERNSLLHLTTTQDLDLAVRASGRISRFRESVKEEFNLLP